MPEDSLANGVIKIGIELEGIGSVSVTWQPDEYMTEKVLLAVMADQRFGPFFKQTKLVRSSSFSETQGAFGTYIVPEEGPTPTDNLTISRPGELVSSPHPFDLTNLERLRASVLKALHGTTMRTPQLDANKKGVKTPDGKPVVLEPQVVTKGAVEFGTATGAARWTRRLPNSWGSLQTTVGVRASQFLNDKPEVRRNVVELLSGDEKKRDLATGLLSAAVLVGNYLADQPLAANANPADSNAGLRLVSFMYLLFMAKDDLKSQMHLDWAKDLLGLNVKGYSSFRGCGVGDDNILKTAISTTDRAEQVALAILGLIQKADKAQWLVGYLKKKIDPQANKAGFADNLKLLGQPDLSMQVVEEKATPIPCFRLNNKLYTVIETREKESKLNLGMGEFFDRKPEERAAKDLLFFNYVKGVVDG